MWSGCGAILAATFIVLMGVALLGIGFDSSKSWLAFLGIGLIFLGVIAGIVGMGVNWYGFAVVYLKRGEKAARDADRPGWN